MTTKYFRYLLKHPGIYPKDFIPYIEEDLEWVRKYLGGNPQTKIDRNIAIWKDYYSSDVTLTELSLKYGVTSSTCSNQIGRINRILKFKQKERR